MTHFLYIIYSESANRFYTGETQNPTQRLLQHNSNYFQSSFTKIATDWELKLIYKCENRLDALYLENFIKKMKSKKFIIKLINSPPYLRRHFKSTEMSALVLPTLRDWRHHH